MRVCNRVRGLCIMVTCLYTPRPPLYPEVLRGHDLLSSCVHVSSLVFQYGRQLWCGILLHHPGRWDFKKCTFIKSKHFASKVLKLDIWFVRKLVTCVKNLRVYCLFLMSNSGFWGKYLSKNLRVICPFWCSILVSEENTLVKTSGRFVLVDVHFWSLRKTL